MDIYAQESGTGKKIVIENQLEDTNHDHLGKLLTYASGKDANIVVWVVKKARDEHKSAIEWLNNHTDEEIGFFLCEIKIYKIGNSEPAVKFEVVEKPNDWFKETKKLANGNDYKESENAQNRLKYWTAFREYLIDNGYDKKLRISKGSTDAWYSMYLGTSKCHIDANRNVRESEVRIEIYINDNKEFYDTLYANKDDIEQIIGKKYDWQRLDLKKASRIVSVRKVADLLDESKWQEQFEWLIMEALRLKEAVQPYIK